MVEKKIFLIWFGKLNSTRELAIKSFRGRSGCEIVLITEENFKNFECKEYPIHELFDKLSSVDKSDYLRAYLMYSYGGGYSDVKRCRFNWEKYFDQLNNNSEIFFLSCPLIDEHGITGFSQDPDVIKKAKSEYYKYASCAQFIFKPKTNTAKQWIDAINQKLDYVYDILKKNPALHPYGDLGNTVGEIKIDVSQLINDYPIKWMDLAGNIFYKIQYDMGLSGYSLNMPQHERSAGKHRGKWNPYLAMYD
jgi:hypothetical protein